MPLTLATRGLGWVELAPYPRDGFAALALTGTTTEKTLRPFNGLCVGEVAPQVGQLLKVVEERQGAAGEAFFAQFL